MEDPPEIVEAGASKHAFHWDTAAQLPTVGIINALKTPELKNAKIKEILDDLSWRMHDALGSKREIERLRLLNVRVIVPNFNAAPATPAPAPEPAAVADNARIVELERQLAASVETNRLQKEAWDGEKAVFAAARVAPDPGSTVAADGAVDADALNQRIIDQQLRIDELSDDVIHWRERSESRTSSTNSNTLDGLLRKLKRVVRLQFDDLDDVYHAVAEAICAHTTPAQRHEIRGAPMNKERFIDFLVDYFSEPTDTSESDESDESGSDESEGTEATDAPNADGIEAAARPPSARRTPRLDSARAQTQNEKAGIARRVAESAKTAGNRFKSAVKRVTGMTADLSTLLSDLKHVSEDDAYAPPI